MTEISTDEFIKLSKLQPEERCDYALSKMIELDHLWGLYGENGWLLLQADEDACLPVFPHEEFAKAWEKDDFPDCEPKQIDFTSWLEQWLPGMDKNATLILVFPLSDDEEGIMLSAKEILGYLQEELDSSQA